MRFQHPGRQSQVRPLAGLAVALLAALAWVATGPVAHLAAAAPQAGHGVSAQPSGHAGAEAAQPGEHAGGPQTATRESEAHDEPLWKTGARLFNFALLAGTLVYFLRAPLRMFFDGRLSTIRTDLVNAADTRRAATQQMAEVGARIAALPGELETLRTSGAADIEAERARIRQAAEAERARLVEQARRQVEQRLRVAGRDLMSRAADVVILAATEHVRQNITAADQARLIERYAVQLPTASRGASAAPAADGGRA